MNSNLASHVCGILFISYGLYICIRGNRDPEIHGSTYDWWMKKTPSLMNAFWGSRKEYILSRRRNDILALIVVTTLYILFLLGKIK
jgi:hypothetical protein